MTIFTIGNGHFQTQWNSQTGSLPELSEALGQASNGGWVSFPRHGDSRVQTIPSELLLKLVHLLGDVSSRQLDLLLTRRVAVLGADHQRTEFHDMMVLIPYRMSRLFRAQFAQQSLLPNPPSLLEFEFPQGIDPRILLGLVRAEHYAAVPRSQWPRLIKDLGLKVEILPSALFKSVEETSFSLESPTNRDWYQQLIEALEYSHREYGSIHPSVLNQLANPARRLIEHLAMAVPGTVDTSLIDTASRWVQAFRKMGVTVNDASIDEVILKWAGVYCCGCSFQGQTLLESDPKLAVELITSLGRKLGMGTFPRLIHTLAVLKLVQDGDPNTRFDRFMQHIAPTVDESEYLRLDGLRNTLVTIEGEIAQQVPAALLYLVSNQYWKGEMAPEQAPARVQVNWKQEEIEVVAAALSGNLDVLARDVVMLERVETLLTGTSHYSKTIAQSQLALILPQALKMGLKSDELHRWLTGTSEFHRRIAPAIDSHIVAYLKEQLATDKVDHLDQSVISTIARICTLPQKRLPGTSGVLDRREWSLVHTFRKLSRKDEERRWIWNRLTNKTKAWIGFEDIQAKYRQLKSRGFSKQERVEMADNIRRILAHLQDSSPGTWGQRQQAQALLFALETHNGRSL